MTSRGEGEGARGHGGPPGAWCPGSEGLLSLNRPPSQEQGGCSSSVRKKAERTPGGAALETLILTVITSWASRCLAERRLSKSALRMTRT